MWWGPLPKYHIKDVTEGIGVLLWQILIIRYMIKY